MDLCTVTESWTSGRLRTRASSPPREDRAQVLSTSLAFLESVAVRTFNAKCCHASLPAVSRRRSYVGRRKVRVPASTGDASESGSSIPPRRDSEENLPWGRDERGEGPDAELPAVQLLVVEIFDTERETLLREKIYSWLQMAIFAGDTSLSSPTRVSQSERGVQLELMSTKLNEVIATLSFVVDSLGEEHPRRLCVTGQHVRPREGGSNFVFPGWRSILRRLVTHLQEVEGRENVRVKHHAPSVRMGRQRAAAPKAGRDVCLLEATIPRSNFVSRRAIVTNLQDWGMGLQFGSHGNLFALRPLPSFFVLPTTHGLEFVFGSKIREQDRRQLEVRVVFLPEVAIITASGPEPLRSGPRAVTNRYPTRRRDDSPELVFSFWSGASGCSVLVTLMVVLSLFLGLYSLLHGRLRQELKQQYQGVQFRNARSPGHQDTG